LRSTDKKRKEKPKIVLRNQGCGLLLVSTRARIQRTMLVLQKHALQNSVVLLLQATTSSIPEVHSPSGGEVAGGVGSLGGLGLGRRGVGLALNVDVRDLGEADELEDEVQVGSLRKEEATVRNEGDRR
jgi:hypothetical protein